MSGRLAGKIAIVTGAGSRGPGLGNGKATAILFAREGAKVLCADQAKERAEETVGVIRGEGGEASAFVADVTHAAECEAMVRSAVERWGGLDILHNNVGIESRKDLLETPEDEWDRVIADVVVRSEEHTSELQSLAYLVCRLLLEKKKNIR